MALLTAWRRSRCSAIARSVSLINAARAAARSPALVGLHQRDVIRGHVGVGVLVAEQAAAHDAGDRQALVAVEQRVAVGERDHPLVQGAVGRKPAADGVGARTSVASISARSSASLLRAQAPDREVGGPELDREPSALGVLDHAEGQRRDHEFAVVVALHEALPAELGERAAHRLRREPELRSQRLGVERRTDRQPPVEELRAQARVRFGVLLDSRRPNSPRK